MGGWSGISDFPVGGWSGISDSPVGGWSGIWDFPVGGWKLIGFRQRGRLHGLGLEGLGLQDLGLQRSGFCPGLHCSGFCRPWVRHVGFRCLGLRCLGFRRLGPGRSGLGHIRLRRGGLHRVGLFPGPGFFGHGAGRGGRQIRACHVQSGNIRRQRRRGLGRRRALRRCRDRHGGKPRVVGQAARADGAALKVREAVRAVATTAADAQPAAHRVHGDPYHAPQHRGGLGGGQPVRPVRGGDLRPGGPAHGDREPRTYRAERDDRRSRLPLSAGAPGLVALDQVLDGVHEAAAVTAGLAGLGQQVQQVVEQATLIDRAEQDQVPVAREHPVTRQRPEPLPANAHVHPASPTRLPIPPAHAVPAAGPGGNPEPTERSLSMMRSTTGPPPRADRP